MSTAVDTRVLPIAPSKLDYGRPMRVVVCTIACLLALAGCSGSETPETSDATSTATSTPALQSTTPEPVVTTESPAIDPALYPKGYPKIVKVSSLPDQVRNWYEMSGQTKAVAVAPGVWTELPPGAEMQDALEAGGLDGFCGSVKAYERKFLGGEEKTGVCW